MTLSPEMREQLRQKAEELRTEVSSLTAERDAALVDKSNDIADAKLIAEVQRLEQTADAARRDRDQAVNGTDEAMRLMIQAVEDQGKARAEKAEAEKAEAVKVEADSKEESPEPDAKSESAPVKKQGGNR